MSKSDVSPPGDFWPIQRIKTEYSISEYMMLKLVVAGRMRYQASPGFSPRYSTADCQRYLDEEAKNIAPRKRRGFIKRHAIPAVK